jgi:hypothetical protein
VAIDQTQRPRFYEGQYLGAEDISAILDHSLVEQSRDRIAGHTWGIALGFNLKESPSAGDPKGVDQFLQPGYAWDGFGRPIVGLQPYKIPPERFLPYVYDPAKDEPAGRLVEIYIGYREIDFDPPQPGFQSCDAADQSSRIQETFDIYIGARPKHSDRHDPVRIGNYVIDAQQALSSLDPAAPQIYDESIPEQTLPDPSLALWLVPLGYVRWKPDPNPAVLGRFLALTADDKAASRAFRIPVGVVAGAVQAADGVIRLKDRTRDSSKVISPDLVWVEGDTRLQGKLSLRDSAGDDHNVPLVLQRLEANAAGGRDLQLVIGKEKAGKNHLAIGPLDAAGVNFHERVTVQDDGNVGVGTTAPTAKIHMQGGTIRWGNNSDLMEDQGGSIELGGNDLTPGTGNPYIDFHFKGKTQDFNARIINDGDNQLSVWGQGAPAVLAVHGEVKLDPGAGLTAPGAVEPLRLLRGTIDGGGGVKAGIGFTVAHLATGIYEITFAVPFSGLPSASATQIFPDVNSFGSNGDTRDNAVINGISTTRLRIITGDSGGSLSDRQFTFTVMGPR